MRIPMPITPSRRVVSLGVRSITTGRYGIMPDGRASFPAATTCTPRFNQSLLRRRAFHTTPTPKRAWFPRLQMIPTMFRNVMSNDDAIDPKRLLERKYLYYAILAAKFRSLRLELPDDEKDELYGRATEELDAKGLDKMGNVSLRQEIQDALHPQVLEIFQAFEKVDEQLSISSSAVQDSDSFASVDWDLYTPILLDEYETTCSEIDRLSNEAQEVNDSIPFLERKRGALRTLLDFHGLSSTGEVSSSMDTKYDTDNDDLDDFGMDVNIMGDRSLKLIRQYQTMNLCRSAMLRQAYGFSVVSLKSLIPGGGRGVFIDGHVKAGSLVAFQPGDIWPKEHLLTNAPDVMEHFAGEDDCQISLRFDDYVVDSRQSPVTVLTRQGSMNPWALGHMVNHPLAGVLPNCQSTMLNYTERMKLGESAQYIPNTYARAPSWQGSFFDPEPLVMHGLCLIMRRDSSNEELLYDYRLQSDETPEWYSVVKYGGDFDDDEQVVFFRPDDWKSK